ncbi:hypothetical protein EMCRGX_G002857 [Ephydatia muelleri]|eukprot:Em1105g1a
MEIRYDWPVACHACLFELFLWHHSLGDASPQISFNTTACALPSLSKASSLPMTPCSLARSYLPKKTAHELIRTFVQTYTVEIIVFINQ